MQGLRVFLICLVFAVSMELALGWFQAGAGASINGAGARAGASINGGCCPWGFSFTSQVGFSSPFGKRSVETDRAEYLDWLRTANLTDAIGLVDTNSDGFITAMEWDAIGAPRDFVEALDLYDANDDNMLTVAEIGDAPFENEGVNEFMVMPMETFDDMVMQVQVGDVNNRPPKAREQEDQSEEDDE